jgi:pyroglutamyl-peptidase
MTVLITGFGPFDGGSNASERLLEALDAWRAALASLAQDEVMLALLPVDTVEAPIRLAALLDEVRPTHVLLTGQAAGRAAICLEQRAVNRRHFAIPDCNGRLLADAVVVQGGPDALAATWPDPQGGVAALAAAGIPAQLSQDCGVFLCNQLLYTVLHRRDRSMSEPAAMFLHIPLTPEQVAAGEPAARRHPDCPSLAVQAAARAVEILLGRLGGGAEQSLALTA